MLNMKGCSITHLDSLCVSAKMLLTRTSACGLLLSSLPVKQVRLQLTSLDRRSHSCSSLSSGRAAVMLFATLRAAATSPEHRLQLRSMPPATYLYLQSITCTYTCRAYKLGKRRWSYNQCELVLHQGDDGGPGNILAAVGAVYEKESELEKFCTDTEGQV